MTSATMKCLKFDLIGKEKMGAASAAPFDSCSDKVVIRPGSLPKDVDVHDHPHPVAQFHVLSLGG